MKTVRAYALAALILIVAMNVVPVFAVVAWNKVSAALPGLAPDSGKVN